MARNRFESGSRSTVIQVKVKPNARVRTLSQVDDGTWLAQLTAPPVEGRVNEELVALVAEHFKCRKAAVSIKSGASSRTKRVSIECPRSPLRP